MQKLNYSGPGERIDKRLSEQLPYSRSFFSHLLERGAVMVRERQVKKSYTLKEGDSVSIDNLERFVDGGILDECPAGELYIVHEKDDYMVIYKPKGVLSHPNSVRDVQHPSVVGGVYHYMKAKPGSLPSSGSFIRAGLVHRLDKETDGLMIVAKTETGLAYFKELFQQKSLCETIEQKELVPLKKYYKATCEITSSGESFLKKIQGQLPYIIQEDVIPKVPHPVIKEGITKILAYEQHDERVSCELEILTGRTHQIRYHLSTYGLPIVGDYVYGKENDSGMQLTAWKLVFVDHKGEEILLEM